MCEIVGVPNAREEKDATRRELVDGNECVRCVCARDFHFVSKLVFRCVGNAKRRHFCHSE